MDKFIIHMAKLILVLSLLLVTGCAGTVSKDLDVQRDSVVIGCIENPVIAPHGFNYYENSGAMPEWRLKNLRMRDIESGEVVDLFLLRNGCFTSSLAPGTYSFEHFIKGNKYYRHDKESFIGQVQVSPGVLVNLGTYHLEVLNIEFYRWAKGDYPIIAGFTGDKKFHQISGAESFALPLEDFIARNPKVFNTYRARAVEWEQVK